MADLISRQQAKEEIMAWAVRIYNPKNLSTEDTMFILDNLPSVDAVVLPCKVGDTLYDVYEAVANGEGDIRVLKVTEIRIHLDKRNKAWLIVDGCYFAIDDFGKTVFLTKEEAEKALERGVGDAEK